MTKERWQFDGVVRLTRIGTSFVIFTVVIGFAAINTGNNALYIGLSLMLGCLLLSGIASKDGLKQLVVEFDGVDEAWAMHPAHGRLRIRNRSRIWNVRDVIVTSDELAAPLSLPLIKRREEIVVHAMFSFRRRGLTHLTRVDLYTRFPFGFFLKKRRPRLTGDVVVFPRLLGDDISRDRFRPNRGDLQSANRIGGGTDIHSFRDYVRGDSLRRVHWKKSASLGRWIIKQTEVETGQSVHIVVDPYRPPEVSEESFEEMISEAATFLDDALRSGLEVAFSIPHVTMRSDRDGAASMFRALALLEAAHEPVAQTVDRDSVIFTVAPGVGSWVSGVGA
ncbi:MAG: DUF58 domain-containing protein [Acidobacteria bacterium]|nr:DUF58 domain-containing protein [Acidobacteriota bacterium]MBV9069463.1 DUF58 domain-containing protein [Acidobacteriota bacterium]MBV9184602.1 DUF58 domain-containing protein [Acidobacteriota bacterium]